MTYCPECGSEVAPENTFCAYCGIALTPVAPIVEEQSESNINSSVPQMSNELQSTEPTPQNETPFVKEAESPAETSGEFAPTLTAFDNQTPENDWSAQLGEPIQNQDLEPKIEDNISKNTGSENNPSFEVDDLQPKEDSAFNPADNAISFDFEQPQQTPVQNADASGNAGAAVGFNPQSDDAKQESDNFSDWDEFPNKQTPSFNAEPDINLKDSEKFENTINPEFEATIPYTPKDFAKQDLAGSTGGKIAENENSQEPKSSEPISNIEPEEPIAKPESPVGSSSHDSLEPRLVSVQIYNPDEKPEGAEAEKEDSIYDSQTLLKHPGTPSQQLQQHYQQPENQAPKESRSYTSPNMGKEDTAGKSKAKLKPLDEGTVLNSRYEIIRKIGGGGMGAVYLASDRNLGGVLRAVKEMVQSYIEDAQQEKAINDFKRESLLLTSLEHQAIPTIFDYFYDEKEGRFYLVMKYISGGDLAGRMRSAPEGRLDEALVTEWGIQIADVLDYLHNRQPPIIYRDLKPSNVMIDGNNGRIMLIDFGIARWVNKEEKGVTAVGTMGYAPPELFSGNVEPRSDIYSLGSTMFHLLTGADPQSNPLLIFDFNKNPRPRQINPNLSDQIEQILMRTVEYNAEKRFSGASELREALINHRENLKKGVVTFGASANAAAAPAQANALVFCGFCGQKIVATDVFCPFCGAQQPTAGQAAKAAPVYVPPKLTARILVVGTNELDTPMFSLEKDTNLVGRRDPMSNIFPEVDLSKFDPQTKISRKHARIWRESDKFMVEDLGSSNGTVLISKTNEPLRLVKNQPHVLSHGDKLRVGDTTLHFVLG